MSTISKIWMPLLLAAVAASCGTDIPRDSRPAQHPVSITPDYTDLVIPCNIAPLNFRIDTVADEYVTHVYSRKNPDGIKVKGRTVDIDVRKWHSLLTETVGDTVFTDIYIRHDGGWTRFPSIRNVVADSIDPYISYRLIEPSYITFETMAICQRHLEDFNEDEIFNSQILSSEKQGQCMNCHSYQDYNRGGNMQLHLRVNHPGTFISHNGSLMKLDLKTPSTVSSGVYPSWHPTDPLIAYSVNTTSQSFHSNMENRVEVQDAESDLILLDVEGRKISVIANEPDELETFPYWHPDGESLWYVSASVPHMSAEEMNQYQALNYKDFKYDIYRRHFNRTSRTFSAPDTIYKASDLGKSATLPRPSPDGRYLLFTQGEFGTFHIWHKDADLYLLDLKDGEVRPLDILNSPDVESYHSWSSNGRWIIFSSRRDDGSYTRLYIAYFDRNGNAAKPFILPQKCPAHNATRMKSYNVPEFMALPVEISKRQLINTIKPEASNVTLQ